MGKDVAWRGRRDVCARLTVAAHDDCDTAANQSLVVPLATVVTRPRRFVSATQRLRLPNFATTHGFCSTLLRCCCTVSRGIGIIRGPLGRGTPNGSS